MIQPVNRYIEVVVRATINPEETTILLSADFKPQEERYRQAIVQSWAPDVRFAEQLSKGCEVVIDHGMIEEIKIGSELLTVIQDNYVIAILTG